MTYVGGMFNPSSLPHSGRHMELQERQCRHSARQFNKRPHYLFMEHDK